MPKPSALRKELWATGHSAHPPIQGHFAIAPPDARQFHGHVPPAGEIDPGFVGDLAAMAASCRGARCALSLLLIGIDRFDELVLAKGVSGAERIVQFLGEACRAAATSDSVCRRAGDDQFALLLPGSDRQAAVAVGNQLLGQMRRLGGAPGQVRPALTVSVGIAAVAVPPKNFAPGDLIESAERCLHAARLSGGNALKSIEI
jgi:diguanylate cyclase (GGDEF)-like protein